MPCGPGSAFPARSGAFGVKARRAAGHPADEAGQTRMGAQAFGCVVVARQFGFCQRGVDFAVTDMVQQNNRAALAAFEFGDQVMQRLRHIRRDRAQAKRADGYVCAFHGVQGWNMGRERQGLV